MSDYKNEVTLTGKLVNPKFINTKSGVPFFSGALMTARRDKRTDQWINSFFNIKAFKEVAESLDGLVKRSEKPKITVKGKLASDEYQDVRGEKKRTFEILVFEYEVNQLTNEQGNKVDTKAVEDIKAYDLGKQIDIDDIPF
jgi:single-stranded DNA-binding protein